MKNLPLGIAALAAVVSFSSAEAADIAALRSYATKALPRCPSSNITVEPIPQSGPAGFQAFKVTQTSSDEHCGSQQLLLYSPTSQQTVFGRVVTLPADSRPVEKRVAEYASAALKVPTTVKFVPFGLPDGMRQVLMIRQTEHGSFSYRGYIDASNKYLLMGWRGSLQEDPGKTIKRMLGLDAAARRGNGAAKVEIIEISDFQCPSCARAHETLEPYFAKNLGKVSYSRLDLPLFEHHEWALPAALAARAINKVAPAKYWRYVDAVFANQESIGKRPFETFLKEFLEDNDIPWSKIQPLYKSPTERAALLEQVSRLYAAGVSSTPTFIVNGQVLGFGDGTHAFEAIKKTVEGK
jgi:protein-disulfide isomerase